MQATAGFASISNWAADSKDLTALCRCLLFHGISLLLPRGLPASKSSRGSEAASAALQRCSVAANVSAFQVQDFQKTNPPPAAPIRPRLLRSAQVLTGFGTWEHGRPTQMTPTTLV